MTAGFDFSRTPEQRRRAHEHRFYRQLAGAALAGVLPVLALAWHIERHTDSLEAGNRLLATEQQALQAQLAQAADARLRIGGMQTRLAWLAALDRRRMQAVRLLRASARAALPSARLYRIVLQAQRAELHGRAEDTREVQAFAEALSHAGLEGATVQELRIASALAETASGTGRYDFTLAAPMLPPPAGGAQ